MLTRDCSCFISHRTGILCFVQSLRELFVAANKCGEKSSLNKICIPNTSDFGPPDGFKLILFGQLSQLIHHK